MNYAAMLHNLPNLNELYFFVQIANAGSFTKAAERLGVTTSALSQNMRSLEKHLDVRLFNRTTRSISTTEAGEKLLAEIAPHFLAIADAVRHLDEIRDEPQGTIRINTSEIAANLIIYPKLQPFLLANPHIKVELVIDNRWVDIVAQGFDMGVRLGYAVFNDMIAVQISEPMKMVLVASPGYLKDKPLPKKINDLTNYHLIGSRFSSEHSQLEWEFMDKGQKVGFQPMPQFSINNDLRTQAALDGFGIAWLPEIRVHEELKNGNLVEILPQYAYTYDPFYIYYPNRKGNSKAFQMVVELLKFKK
nr:LysR family transcriptional regulator [[Mannheimia] succiniciproducens]